MIGAKQRAPRSEGAHPSSHREPDSASPRGSVGDARAQRGHAVQYRGGSGDERAGWTPWRVGDVGPGAHPDGDWRQDRQRRAGVGTVPLPECLRAPSKRWMPISACSVGIRAEAMGWMDYWPPERCAQYVPREEDIRRWKGFRPQLMSVLCFEDILVLSPSCLAETFALELDGTPTLLAVGGGDARIGVGDQSKRVMKYLPFQSTQSLYGCEAG